MTRATWRSPLLVLLAACLVVILSTGTRHTFGLFLRPMTETFGWGREVFALAIALQNLVWGLSQPLTGMLADRYGAGRVLAAGGLTYALGLLLMSQAGTPLVLTLSAGLLIGLGLSATGFAVVFGAVSRAASERRRSLYMGIAASGGSVGMFLMIPIGQGLISGLGWVQAMGSLALLALVMPLLAVVLVGRAGQPAASEAVTNPVQALRQAGRQRRYWLLFWGFFVCGFHVAFISTHLPAFLADNAVAPAVAALALSLIGLFNILGSLTLSYLGGRYSKRKLLCALYLARAVVIAVFIALPLSTASVLAFAGAMGFLWLATVPLTSGLVGQMYGVRYLSTLFGIVFLGHQIGSFLGVWSGGFIYDLTGSYTLVWYAAVALGLFSALIHWPIDERSSEELERAARLAKPLAEEAI
jgi:MFS family permease